jgi:beta-xylosidase
VDRDTALSGTSDLVLFSAEGKIGGDLEFWALTVENLLERSNEFLDYGPAPESGPIWLRLDRTNDDWTFEYSENGDDWVEVDTQHAADEEAFAMTVAAVGFHLGNINPDYPEDTIKFDYFFENSARIEPEDPVDTVRRVMVRG